MKLVNFKHKKQISKNNDDDDRAGSAEHFPLCAGLVIHGREN
jgi:hypothetical protein